MEFTSPSNHIRNLFACLCLSGYAVRAIKVCVDPNGNVGTCEEGWECCVDGTKCCAEKWPMLTITGIVIGCIVGVLLAACCGIMAILYTACNQHTKPRRLVYANDSQHIHTIACSEPRLGPVIFSAQGPPAYQCEPPSYEELTRLPGNSHAIATQKPTSGSAVAPISTYTEPPPYTEEQRTVTIDTSATDGRVSYTRSSTDNQH